MTGAKTACQLSRHVLRCNYNKAVCQSATSITGVDEARILQFSTRTGTNQIDKGTSRLEICFNQDSHTIWTKSKIRFSKTFPLPIFKNITFYISDLFRRKALPWGDNEKSAQNFEGNSDIGKINTWLLNGQLYLEERNYTSLNIDGTTYTGSTTILWIRITNAAKTRQMLLGKMISSSVSDLYTNFVSGSKILVQTVTDATWSNVRSL